MSIFLKIKQNISTTIWNSNLPFKVKSRLIFIIKYLRKKRPFGFKQFQLVSCLIELVKLNFHKNKNAVITVYDFNDSPPAIGNFIYWIMLIRFLNIICSKVIVVIIENKKNTKNRETHLRLFKNLCPKNYIHTFSSIEELTKQSFYKKSFFLFKEKVLKNQKAQIYYFNFLNISFRFLLKNKEEDFLISKLVKIPDSLSNFFKLNSDNICISFRYSNKNSPLYELEKTRNTSEAEFIKVIQSIRENYPNKKIFVLSDKEGSAFFKKVAIENSIDCHFSKDFFDDFLLDAELILNSKLFIQLNGGGISPVAFFSKIPYLICAKNTNFEYAFSESKLNYWSKRNQWFKEISIDDEFYYHLKKYYSNFQ